MARVISVVNQKGGVGKTTSSTNIAAALAAKGRYVLLVDLDPQANATSGLGVNPREVNPGLYHAILGSVPFMQITRPVHFDTLHLAPAHPDLAGANVELVNEPNRERRLYETLLPIRNNYDLILIDCPPSLGLLTLNGMVAADDLLIPIQAEYYALEGISNLLETTNMLRENLKPDLRILGAVVTMFDRRVGLSQAIFEELYKYFPDRIFRTVIPRSVKLAEAPSHGLPINKYDPTSPGAVAYDRLAEEILQSL